MNKVLNGEFKGSLLFKTEKNEVMLCVRRNIFMPLNRNTVHSFELVDSKSKKSASSAVGRAIVGGALLGGVGMLAGGLTGKTNQTILISITMNDGTSFIAEVDGNLYRQIIVELYDVDGSKPIPYIDLDEFLIDKRGEVKMFFIALIIIILVCVNINSCNNKASQELEKAYQQQIEEAHQTSINE